MLDGKQLLITGVVDDRSIGFAIARRALDQGAEVVLTAPPRDAAVAARAATALGCELLELDLTDPEAVETVTAELRARRGHLDGAVHAVAFAPRDALDGELLDARPASIEVAFRTSVVTYAALGGIVAGLAPATGGSLVGLDFDGGGAWPTYNWMGVCKAALQETSRYLARDLGPRGVRSNLVAAGPLHTRAAGGIPGFDRLLDAWARQAPLPWVPTDPAPVADTVCFLLSDGARAITGEVVHVDGGFHAMATALRPSPIESHALADAVPADPASDPSVVPSPPVRSAASPAGPGGGEAGAPAASSSSHPSTSSDPSGVLAGAAS